MCVETYRRPSGRDLPVAPSSQGARPVSEPTSKKKSRPARTERVAMPSGPNPRWLAPAMITLFVVALVYLVVAYLFNMQWPLPIGNWNLVVGFTFAIVGFGLATRWK